MATSWALAALSYRFFEEPILEYARKTSSRWIDGTTTATAQPAAAA
jgi:peptidoglycan/LPS O-acetylase OafA/YrhL